MMTALRRLMLALVATAAVAGVARGEDARPHFVRISMGDLGRLLERVLESKDFASLSAKLDPAQRSSLVRQLGRASRISVVERLVPNEKGELMLDKKWTPRVSIDGSTTGILDGEMLGEDADLCYSVHVELRSIFLREDVGDRQFLMFFSLEFNGKGLSLGPEIEGLAWDWQLATRVSLSGALAELRKDEQSSSDSDR